MIVNMSSMDGIASLPANGFYSASKFALEGMTELERAPDRREEDAVLGYIEAATEPAAIEVAAELFSLDAARRIYL
jgi:short chain dehydrogenase